MNRPLQNTTRIARAVVTLLALAACSDRQPTVPEIDVTRSDSYLGADHGSQPFTVYTQNVYLGGDTGPILSLDFNNIPALLQATNLFWGQVQQSDIPGRVAAIVDEIEARRPHVVGLQEVFQFAVVDPRNGAVLGGADILASIQAEIAARGLPYEIVAVQSNTSSALPLAIDFQQGRISKALAFTDRVAALRRTDVTLVSSAHDTYAARFQAGPVTLTRGWIRMSVTHEGVPYHFVTTHLEVQSLAPVQAGQARELLGSVVAGLEGVTIVAGDLNSDAAAGPGAPSWTPTYDFLTGAGFTDAWIQSGQKAKDPGYTCCQATDLRNAVSELDERIDLVLVRSSSNPASARFVPGSMSVEIVGEEASDRTASGLWRTDHAGLVAGLRLPQGLTVR